MYPVHFERFAISMDFVLLPRNKSIEARTGVGSKKRIKENTRWILDVETVGDKRR